MDNLKERLAELIVNNMKKNNINYVTTNINLVSQELCISRISTLQLIEGIKNDNDFNIKSIDIDNDETFKIKYNKKDKISVGESYIKDIILESNTLTMHSKEDICKCISIIFLNNLENEYINIKKFFSLTGFDSVMLDDLKNLYIIENKEGFEIIKDILIEAYSNIESICIEAYSDNNIIENNKNQYDLHEDKTDAEINNEIYKILNDNIENFKIFLDNTTKSLKNSNNNGEIEKLTKDLNNSVDVIQSLNEELIECKKQLDNKTEDYKNLKAKYNNCLKTNNAYKLANNNIYDQIQFSFTSILGIASNEINKVAALDAWKINKDILLLLSDNITNAITKEMDNIINSNNSIL